MKIHKISILLFMLCASAALAQVENVPIANPVYDFLLRAETRGMLPHFSLSQLPWQRNKIVHALELVRSNDSLLSKHEKAVLAEYEVEFEIRHRNNAVVFYSKTDTVQVLSSKMLSDYEKLIYRYKDASNAVAVEPLMSLDYINLFSKSDSNYILMGTLGGRIYGTIADHVGYYLQVTNAAKLLGYEDIAYVDNKYFNNTKYRKLNSDADMSESHVAVEFDWFYASIGRETRLNGAGLKQRVYVNDLSPAFDALTLAARFNGFEYRFSHNSLLNFPLDLDEPVWIEGMGAYTVIPPKYMAMHSFTLLPSWGEVSFFESVIYSRDVDLAYLNPLSFLKTLEHAQHDRDNSGMGLSAVVRPVKNLQLKGTWFLDDIIIDNIGTGYWSNKTAWNVAGIVSVPKHNLDFGLEYSRTEPYTFSHFNPQNSNTNDSVLFSSYIPPNSDQWNMMLQYWWGQRYPVKLNMSYTRHGANIYDDAGNLVRNVGGDPLLSITKESDPSGTVVFLDGNLIKTFAVELSAGIEIIRGFNLQLAYSYQHANGINRNYARAILRFSDF